MISKGNLPCEIELEACFCQGRCTEGVVIRIDDEIITGVSTENIENIVLTRLKNK
jgi:NADH:ubiquinone oxidoreductase subunit E